MIIKLQNILFIFLVSLPFIQSVEDNYKPIREVPMEADFVRSDELGNVFVIDGNQLTKYDKSGEKLHVYSNLYAGNIDFVDTHDPFKIMLFYQEFGQVEFLDRTLSLSSSRIDLAQLGYSLSTLACASYQGAFWIYDPTNFELIRIDQSLEISERSGNLQQATGYTLNPNYMLERDNSLYLNDPGIGILIFDKYGSYYKTIPEKGLHAFQVFDRKIIFSRGDTISIYDTRRNELSTAQLPRSEYRSVSACLSTDPPMIFILGGKKLFFYEID